MRFSPRAYQLQAIDHLAAHPRCALWAGMGMGKTVSTLTALDTLALAEEDIFPALVIAPLRVARSTWPAEIGKWAHLRHLRISPIVGDQRSRKSAMSTQADIYTTNYEQLPWILERVGDRWPYPTVVADESTKLKGFRLRQGTQRARALGRIAHTERVKRLIELTGTPAPNGLIDLWGQAWFLDAGQRLGRTFDGFRQRWFQAIPGGEGYQQLRPLANAQAEIQLRLRDLCLTLDPRDHFDLRAPICTTLRVDLPPKILRTYRQFEREMFMDLEGNKIEAFNAASRTIKCLQMCNGAVYTDDAGNWTEVHDAKIDALAEVVEEAAGAPVLVAYHFKSDLARLQKAFPKARVLDVESSTIEDWNAGKIPILLAHPASAGHGLNLQDGGNIIAFFGHWWNLEERDQIIERIGPVRQAQAGYDRPVFIYDIVAADTVDELVMARRESKRSVQDILLEAMKRKGK
ncbi:MAG: DEAD/DEAH box helicase [Rhodocyclaceae bacterium]|nr:DEAD/DEAH box helicase [Rhodocyclaceae bacterium]